MRQIGVFVALLLAWFQPMALAAPTAGRVALAPPSTREDKIRMEADYILASQYLGTGPAYGALNNVHGDPTWVVPRENGLAIMALLVAAQVVGDDQYKIGAERAGDYLVKTQQPDGCWCDQYIYGAPANLSKSPSQTAEVMMALFKLGYRPNTEDPGDRYDAMKRGAQCLMSLQEVAHKGGQDDGLLSGGKDADGNYRKWRWTDDNAYAYWALRMAAFWAFQGGERDLAARMNASAQQVAGGLMAHLYDSSTGAWHIAIDETGAPQWISGLEGRPSWIQYAPVMLDMPLGVNRERVGEWIHNTFQQDDGSCIGWERDGERQSVRKHPGLAFQSSLVWLDTARAAPTQGTYTQAAMDWAEASGLWQTAPDQHGIAGGWIDWVEVSPDAGLTAEAWARFIDTSAYAIFSWNGGYDFGMPEVSLPLTMSRLSR